ncbi:hypothetical protein BC826DRAFT_1092072 [Russula brevipes]|nr:hypothetical protein BC826DRAFT_1092072 [Russula brevipes]
MGVHGLATYLRENIRILSTPLVLSQEQSSSRPTPLVVDGWSFIYQLHNQSRLPWVYGGELGEFRDLVIRIVRAWISVGLRPYFVFDGVVTPLFCPYRPSKFATSANRMTQSIIQPSLLFFRSSPLTRATPRFLRENSILPPLCYAATLDALRSLNDAVEVHLADDEGDPFAVELAGRLKAYVTGRDSDYVILNSEGYAGYLPMDQYDAGFVMTRKNKARGSANEATNSLQGIIPPDPGSDLSLSCVVYTPHGLASHFQISISLLPLLAALIGNDFTADRHPTNKLFFERNTTASQRIMRVASVLNRKARHQIANVVDFVDLTIESLLIRSMSMGSGERANIIEKTVDAALQYTIPKNQDGGDGSISCVLHDADSCPLVGSLSRPVSDHPENETEARKQVRSQYISAYRHGQFSPGLMDILSTGNAWPESFLENPDVETVSRSLGRPIREWVYALLDDGTGLIENGVDAEGNGVGETSAMKHPMTDDVVEEDSDSDEDMGSGNPLAPLQGALDELTMGAKPPPSISSRTTTSRSMRPKYVTEHVRRGTRHAEEPVSVPPLATLLSAHDIDINIGNDPNIRPIQLEDEDFRMTVFLRSLGSNTRLVKALPSEYLMAVVSLRWIVSRLAIRADEAQPSLEREKEKWTIKEAQAFLASFSWSGGTSIEATSPPLENRSIQLTAQILATFDAVEMLSQVLLLTDKVPNPAPFFSGKAFHQRLSNGATSDTHLPPSFAQEKEGKRKRGRRVMENKAKPAHGPAVGGVRGQSMFDVLSALGESV